MRQGAGLAESIQSAGNTFIASASVGAVSARPSRIASTVSGANGVNLIIRLT
jgi:hypothetical protein